MPGTVLDPPHTQAPGPPPALCGECCLGLRRKEAAEVQDRMGESRLIAGPSRAPRQLVQAAKRAECAQEPTLEAWRRVEHI